MGEEVINKIDQYIQELASGLGVAAEHLYSVLVKQKVVEGVVGLSIGIIMLAIAIIVAITLIKAAMNASYEKNRYDYVTCRNWQAKLIYGGESIPAIFLIIASVGVFSGSFPTLYIGIGKLINPEYYAIKEILKVVGG